MMADAMREEASADGEEEHAKEAERQPVEVTVTDIELEALRHQVQDYKDKYLRVLAESENSRKRLQKERQEMIQYATENLIVEFLHPIDQMESALKHTDNASGDVKQWGIGFQMILTHFKDVLASNGIISFSSVGQIFDPHIHEAVEMIVTDSQPPNTVVEETIKGYKMGEKVIRPSCVKVAKAPEEAGEK